MPSYLGPIVTRREPSYPERLPDRANVRAPVGTRYDAPGDPVNWGAWESVGKPTTHAKSFMPIAVSTAVAAYFAVMQDNFGVRKTAHDTGASTPKGKSKPFTERTNVMRSPAAAYGSLFSLQNPQGMGF